MFSLEPELRELGADGPVIDSLIDSLIARERHEIVSVFAELRFLTWLGVMLIMIGVGGIVAEHLDEIGPMTIAIAIAAASVACFIWCWRRRRTNRSSLIDDYILLLSALLLSTDAGYIEHVWNLRLLGPLVIVLALIAYDFDSRMVLSVALGALATWFGVERRVEFFWNEHSGNAIRAFLCSATIFGWLFANVRFKARPSFNLVFAHFATNIAFWGALMMMVDDGTRAFGCLIALALAVASALYGLRQRLELFVVYAWVYGVIAADVLGSVIFDSFNAFFILVWTFGAIVGLFITHARMRRES